MGALQEENAQLEDQLVGYEELQQENEQLKTQLGLEEEEPENELRAASVIGRDPNDVFYGFSIDAGTLSGVSVGDPVITDQGLVGVVTQAYATSSKVTCLLSEDVHVAAWSPKRQESGVIESDVTSASTGVLRLNYLSGDTQIQEGDIIATSGEGGAFPQGLKIGTVARVEKSENDISRFAVIQPFEDLTKVQEVYVVVDFPGKGEGLPRRSLRPALPARRIPSERHASPDPVSGIHLRVPGAVHAPGDSRPAAAHLGGAAGAAVSGGHHPGPVRGGPARVVFRHRGRASL